MNRNAISRKAAGKMVCIAIMAILMVMPMLGTLAAPARAEELMAAVEFDVLVDGNAIYGEVPVSLPRLDMVEDAPVTGEVSSSDLSNQDSVTQSGPDISPKGSESIINGIAGADPYNTDADSVNTNSGGAQGQTLGTEVAQVSAYKYTMQAAERQTYTTARLRLGAYTNGYDNKMYLSMRDLAVLLSGTTAQFQFTMDYELDSYEITLGAPYEGQEPSMVAMEPEILEGDYYDRDGNLLNADDEIVYEEAELWEPARRPDYEYLQIYLNPLNVNRQEVRYYTYQLSIMRDLYVDIIDAQLMLGITVERAEDGSLLIYTDRGYDIDLSAFEADGYFDLYNGIILGDATTGEILYGCKADNMDAIASTSKLMTYMVVARYIETGRIGMDDVVTLSQNVENLSHSGYGTLWMDAGWEITVRDLIGAMLITSSNESALALAEYVAGSEAQFVDLMNEMARVLELDSARFYNSNGLPVYSDSLIASKQQNRMNVRDLFSLSQAILRKYPEVTEYTSSKSMYLPTFDFTVWNTSYLLYNMDNAIGLKTGTTDEAGCCLVGAIQVDVQGEPHTLIAIILGADSNIDRYQVPEVLLTWGTNQLLQRASLNIPEDISE